MSWATENPLPTGEFGQQSTGVEVPSFRRHPVLTSVIAAEIAAILVLGTSAFVVFNDNRIRQLHGLEEKELRTLDHEALRVAAQIPSATVTRTYERRDNFNFVYAESLLRFDPAPSSEIRELLSNWNSPMSNRARDCEERGVSALEVTIRGAEGSGVIDRLDVRVSGKLCR